MNIKIDELVEIARQDSLNGWKLEGLLLQKKSIKENSIDVETLCKIVNMSITSDMLVEIICPKYMIYHTEYWQPLIEEFKTYGYDKILEFSKEINAEEEFKSLSMFGLNVCGNFILYSFGFETFAIHYMQKDCFKYEQEINNNVGFIGKAEQYCLNFGMANSYDYTGRKDSFDYLLGIIKGNLFEMYGYRVDNNLSSFINLENEKNYARQILNLCHTSKKDIEKVITFKNKLVDPLFKNYTKNYKFE